MAKKVFNMQGGLHSAAAYSALENRAWGNCVASAASFVVTPGAGMNLSISTGDGLISVDAFNARRIQVTATETVAVPAASAAYNRLDTVVAYIDTAINPTTAVIDNINDILKFAVVAGTAAATPVAPTDAAILAAIGAGKPFMPLYDVLVPQNAINTAGVTLTDRRKVLTTVNSENIAAGAVTTAKLGALAVTAPKIDFSTFPMQVTDAYHQFHITPGVSGTTGNSYSRTVNLPRAVAAGEDVMLFPIGHRWCTAEFMSKSSTQFTFEMHCTVTTASMQARWSAIYFKKAV